MFQSNIIKIMKIPLKYKEFSPKISKNTTALHFPEMLPKKTKKWSQQIEFMTKHRMFSLKVYLSPDNFTQAGLMMFVTFCKSAARACLVHMISMNEDNLFS